MVLEATIICLDNSEPMRNGDFSPSRFEAQQDASNLICGKKTSANMENAVGLIASAGKSVEVCVSLTQDLGKILSGLHKVKIGGESDLVTAIQIASLALRHRQNKRQEQRIVVFVGSPVIASEAELKRLGGQLKKNKIAVDIVSFGENCAEENRPKLEAFHAAVNNHDNSFMVTLPPGEHMLSQMIASTPIVRGVDAGPAAPGAPAASNFDEYGGVDPNVDPELAMALRLSLESAENERKSRDGPAPATTAPDAAPAPAAPAGADAMDVDDMDEELRAAIALSLQTAEVDANKANAAAPTSAPSTAAPAETQDAMDVDDDDELQKALQMSKQTTPPGAAPEKEEGTGAVDSNFMSSVLLNLEGMDANDPEVKKILEEMKKNEQEKK